MSTTDEVLREFCLVGLEQKREAVISVLLSFPGVTPKTILDFIFTTVPPEDTPKSNGNPSAAQWHNNVILLLDRLALHPDLKFELALESTHRSMPPGFLPDSHFAEWWIRDVAKRFMPGLSVTDQEALLKQEIEQLPTQAVTRQQSNWIADIYAELSAQISTSAQHLKAVVEKLRDENIICNRGEWFALYYAFIRA